MDIRRFDIAFDFFIEMMGEEAAQELKDGQDVTEVFSEDIARPVKAVIIEAEGPGGGNPFVELAFMDEDHSWEWYKENMSQGDAEIDVEEYELARDIAA
jgi:hypothetical protein